MASSLELLSAGFSAILGIELKTKPEAGMGEPKKISVLDLFKATYVMRPQAGSENLFIKTLSGKTLAIPYESPTCTIEQVKARIEDKEGIPVENMRLIYSGKALEDDKTLDDCGLLPGEILFMVLRLQGGGFSQLDDDELDPRFDYDFSNEKDDGHKYMRGGFEYKRPYGWKRYAIKVRGRYGTDVWLGPDGIRTQQAAHEWPVSYHGTCFKNANSILEKGFKPGDGDLYGKGIYSSPSLEMVENHYAQEFKYKRKTYKIVFQNRVNPDQSNGRLKVIPASVTGVGAEYWVSPKQNAKRGVYDVRPYGILIKEVK